MTKTQDWTEKDEQLAGMQGWLIAGGIERVDDMLVFCPRGDGNPIFDGDEDARAYVEAQAGLGDPLAMKALAIIATFPRSEGTLPSRQHSATRAKLVEPLQYSVVITKTSLADSPEEAVQIVLGAIQSTALGGCRTAAGAIIEVFRGSETRSVLEQEI